MRNPFKKNTEEHDELWDAIYSLTQAHFNISSALQELRDEVDFLIDELDD